MLIPHLRSLGLQDNESRIYLALLEAGSMSVSLLSKRIGLSQDETYDILGSLRDKGIVRSKNQGTVKYFTAVEPAELASVFKDKGYFFDPALSKISSLNVPWVHSFGRTFDGLNAIQVFFNEIPSAASEILMVCSLDRLKNFLTPEFFIDWNNKRVKKKVRLRVLSHKTSFKSRFCKIHFLPQRTLLVPSDMIVFGDNVTFLEYQAQGRALLVSGYDLSRTLRSVFEITWKDVVKEHDSVYRAHRQFDERLESVSGVSGLQKYVESRIDLGDESEGYLHGKLLKKTQSVQKQLF